MTTLTRLSMYPDPRPHMSNEERLQILRRVWPEQLGNNYFRFSNRERSVTEQGACMESASFMEQDVVERSNKEPLQRGMTDSHKPVQVRQRIDTNQFNGANARVDGRACESEMGFLASHQKPEIDTGRSTLSRSQSASNNSLPVGGLAPTTYEPDPPTQEEIAEAFYWKYGLADETE